LKTIENFLPSITKITLIFSSKTCSNIHIQDKGSITLSVLNIIDLQLSYSRVLDAFGDLLEESLAF